jgi:8-oxo-dGTP pyrophosphatase MutT (NUDIX family)
MTQLQCAARVTVFTARRPVRILWLIEAEGLAGNAVIANGPCPAAHGRFDMTAGSFDVRCSVVVLRKHEVLLLHRTRDGLDDWVLPGGTPRGGESAAACARRELLEETGVSADPSQVALVVESAVPGSARRLLDLVFIATIPAQGREVSREPRLQPCFIPPDQLTGLVLHPPVAAHLIRLLDPGISPFAHYVANVHAAKPEPRPQA